MSAVPVLILPGLGDSGPDHWQSHWQRRDAACRRVHQDEWDTPHCDDWVARLDATMADQRDPVVFAAHSSACALVAHWAARAAPERLARVRGALLVAPSDPDHPNYPPGPRGFGPVPLAPLPFASTLVASADDRYVSPQRARAYADAWGSAFALIDNAGHINAASGFGPWPQGYAWLEALRHPVPRDTHRVSSLPTS